MERDPKTGTEAGRRPTLADVAAAAGVSRALASIVMRGASGASPATRERVLETARQLGYRPDSRARLLRSSRTRLLGITFMVAEPFHGDIVESIYAAAEDAGFEVLLSAVGGRRQEDRAVETLLDAGVEAALMISPSSTPEALAVLARQVPVISLLSAAAVPGVDAVRSDDAEGIRTAVEHLLSLGHRDIAHVDGGSAVASAERRAGYEESMRRAGLAEYIRVVPGGPHEAEGIAAAGKLFADRKPSAVLAFNDRCALGILEASWRAGLKVPDDLSVVGYDDSQLARLDHVRLTTVSQDAAGLAEAAVGCAAARIRTEEPGELVLQPRLVVRSTTGPA
ncbi:LacI family transcriptional regulator [Arthrobacter crystallopoietes BAB-32]|uniref:LacI family transcriptional regulator n=1 Tax=Arthrobacter crystallopoietes BAB-32 TaxID=1246476 RepID=N1UWI5_9MICC|nr:LacI family DNA-binding transcriptional regulator [Arthrobacter crystallopoietes]EMY33425.1 LacI family transcriptional regulator [Arthrobacter crystallopoietes BAB-32]